MAKKIEVALVLDNSKFNRSLQTSETKVDQFSKKSTSSIKGLGAAFAALGGASLVQNIVSIGQSFQDLQTSLNFVTGSAQAGERAFDNLVNLATRTQFGVEELVQSFIILQGSGIEPTNDLLLSFADTASVAQDQLGVLESLVSLFSRAASKGKLELEDLNKIADRGIPIYKVLTDSFGLTIDEIKDLAKTASGQDQLFRGIQKALEDTYGGALQERLQNSSIAFSNLAIAARQLAAELFTGLGLDSTTAIEGLTEAINQLSKNIEPLITLGKGLAQIFAVATIIFPFARALRAASTAMFSLQRGTSVFAAGASSLSGIITKLGGGVKARLIAPFVAAGKAISRLFKPAGGTDILSGLGRLKLAAQKVGEGLLWIGGTVLGIKGLQNAFQGATDIAETFAEKMGPPRKLFEDDQAEKLAKLTEEYNKLTDNDTLFDETPIAEDTRTALQKYLDILDDVIPATTDFEEQFKVLQDTLGEPKTVGEIDDFESALTRLRAAFGVNTELDNLIESFENIESIEDYNEKLTALQGLLNSSKISADEFADAKEKLDEKLGENSALVNFIETLNSATDTLSDDLATALLEGQSALDSFKSFFKTIITQVIADALKLLLIIPILEAIGFTTTGGSITGLSGSGFLGLFKQTGIGGGNLMANRPVLVGESGPEVFYPSNSGTLAPNGGGTNVTYNINAIDPRSFKEILAQDPSFVYAVTRAGARKLPGVV